MDRTTELAIGLTAILGLTLLLKGDKKKEPLIEPFINVKQTHYPVGHNVFYSRGEGKAHLSPRMFSSDYTSHILGANPPAHIQAVPQQPVEMSDQPGFQEDFANMASSSSGQYGDQVLSQYSQEEIDAMIQAKHMDTLEYTEPADLLPTGDMENTHYGRLMSDPETFVYDRHIVVNQRRRNLEGADFLRGDLYIEPIEGEWMRPSVKPALDLRPGAFGTHIGSDFSTYDDAGDTTVVSERANAGIQFRRHP